MSLKSEASNVIIESKETQINLAIIAKQGDVRAQQKLVSGMIPFIISCSNYYGRVSKKSGVSGEDLVGEGIKGAYTALERFNPDMDTKFSTYAEWYVRNAMQTAIRVNIDEGSQVSHVSTSTPLEEDSTMSIIDVIIDSNNINESTHSDNRKYLKQIIAKTRTLTKAEELTLTTILTGNFETMEEAGEALGIKKQAIFASQKKAIAKIRTANKISVMEVA